MSKKKGTIQMSNGIDATAEVNASENPNPVWLTLSLASGYMGISKAKLKTILASPKNAAIFNDSTVKTTHFHPEVPDLVEIDRAALDAFVTAKEAGKVGTRATRSGKPRKYTVYIPDAISAEVQSLLDRYADQGVSYEAAYKARAKKDAPVTDAAPQDSAAPVDLIEELIEA